jgi:ATP-dependent RNA helicase DeaD
MDRLREGNLRFLVATDVVARGIDISDLSHVFLYDIPEHTEVYVHRSGRTARAGNTGIAVTLCEKFEEPKLLAISRQYHFPLEFRELPTEEEVAARTAERLIVHLEEIVSELSISEKDRIGKFLPIVETLTGNEDSKLLLAYLLDQAYIHQIHMPPVQQMESERLQKKSAQADAQDGRPKRNRRRKPRERKNE